MEIRIEFFSQQIKHLREEHQLTQEELAHQLGISRQSIIAFERGRCLPSLPLAMSLADLFDLALENMFLPEKQEDIIIESKKEMKTTTRDLISTSPMRGISNLPSINIYEKNHYIIVEVDVPGVKEENLSIEVGDDHLIIQGERKSETEIKEKNYYRQETSFGAFSRTIPLPAEVDKNKTQAELKDGTLMVTMPKKTKTTPKTTKIKVKKS